MKPIHVGLLGLGTVGSGTIEVLRRNREEISRRAGREIVIKVASAKDLTKERKVSLEGIDESTRQFLETLNPREVTTVAD